MQVYIKEDTFIRRKAMKTTKAELIKELQERLRAEEIRLTRKEVKIILNKALTLIMEKVSETREVSLRDFGTFRKVVRRYRIREREGKTVTVKFTPGKGFRKGIANRQEAKGNREQA